MLTVVWYDLSMKSCSDYTPTPQPTPDKQSDRQPDKQTDNRTDRKTTRQADIRQTSRPTAKQTDRQTERQMQSAPTRDSDRGKQSNIRTEGHTELQTDGHASRHRPADRQPSRHAPRGQPDADTADKLKCFVCVIGGGIVILARRELSIDPSRMYSLTLRRIPWFLKLPKNTFKYTSRIPTTKKESVAKIHFTYPCNKKGKRRLLRRRGAQTIHDTEWPPRMHAGTRPP